MQDMYSNVSFLPSSHRPMDLPADPDLASTTVCRFCSGAGYAHLHSLVLCDSSMNVVDFRESELVLQVLFVIGCVVKARTLKSAWGVERQSLCVNCFCGCTCFVQFTSLLLSIFEISIQEVPQLAQQMLLYMWWYRICPTPKRTLISHSISSLSLFSTAKHTFSMRSEHVYQRGHAQHRLCFGFCRCKVVEIGLPTGFVEHASKQDQQTLPFPRRDESLVERVVERVVLG